MAYVYRHIRLDKNEPFYIGIGTDEKYVRANSKHQRNDIWNNIVSKTSYRVDIILDDLTWEEACRIEKEFISIYGRININTGMLSNMTDGGDGTVGFKFTKESRYKMSKTKIGKSMPSSFVNKRCKPIVQESIDGNPLKIWKSSKEVQKFTGFSQANISRCCNGEYKQCYGYKWKYI